MPKQLDHRKARVELAKLAPEALRAITVRLPAGLLVEVHQWAEQKGLDLATAMRDLTALGREAASRPGGPASAADRNTVKKWKKPVERALRAGQSPIEPFLAEEDPEPDLKALPTILTGLDYQSIFREVKGKREVEGPWVERAWKRMKVEAPPHLEPLMAALDNLEKEFLARKKLYHAAGPDQDTPIIRWLLSDTLMQRMRDSSSDDAEVKAVQQLISARFLVADNPNQPWDFAWDD